MALLEAHFRARYRTLAEIRARLLRDGQDDPDRLSRLDMLSAEIGSAYFEVRTARAEAARRTQA